MANWSHSTHQFNQASEDFNDPGFRPGIDLTLNQLLETRVKPVIDWLAPNSLVKTNRVGGFRSRFKGRGMDFDESRIYQIGDDIRNIDWKVTARTGEAHTKLFKEERERPVFTILDQMPNMFFGTAQVFKSLIACHITAQLMWNTLSEGDRFGALLFSQNNHIEMKPSSNRKHCMRLLNRIVVNYQQRLVEYFSVAENITSNSSSNNQLPAINPMMDTLKRLRYLAKPGTIIHLVSDFCYFDESCERQLSKLSQHCDIHCIFVSDPIESQLPPSGSYGITNGQDSGILNTAQSDLRKEYAKKFATNLNRIKDFAIAHRGAFTSIDTNYAQQSTGHSAAKKQPSNHSFYGGQ